MSDTDLYFEKRVIPEDLDANGDPGPLIEVGLSVTIPTVVNGEIVDGTQGVHIRPQPSLTGQARIVPGTRIVHTRDQVVAAVLLSSNQYDQVPPPKNTRKEKTA